MQPFLCQIYLDLFSFVGLHLSCQLTRIKERQFQFTYLFTGFIYRIIILFSFSFFFVGCTINNADSTVTLIQSADDINIEKATDEYNEGKYSTAISSLMKVEDE